MKRFLVVIVSIVLCVIWLATIVGIGKVGPINKDIKLGLDISGGVYVVLEAETNASGTNLQTLMEQTQTVIERRVNEMGLSEPIVTVEGEKRIRVELPGAKDADEAIEQVGKTAQLSFHTADGKTMLTGNDVKDAAMDTDRERGGYLVDLTFTEQGGEGFAEATRIASENTVKEEDAIQVDTSAGGIITNSGLYPIMTDSAFGKKNETKYENISPEAINTSSVAIILDDELISAPTAEQEIKGENAVITGGFTKEEAQNLAMLIRGGALPVELTEVESSEVGASIGMGALENSVYGGIIGICLIFILMLVMYRIFGLAANLALLLYVPLMLWVLVLFKGVLTLPGIAGIILSIGMAVDANVIIFARIKEEARSGKSLALAASQGFRRALSTIIDSQLTTLIASIVLYFFGTGSVRGFALTLMIGIILGVFTALVISQVYVQFIVSTKALSRKSLIGFSPLPQDEPEPERAHKFSFVRHRRIYYIVTAAILVIGIGFGVVRGFNMGIDFTGGTRIQLAFEEKVNVSELETALKKYGISDPEITSSGKASENTVMIKTKKALDKDDRQKLEADFAKSKTLKMQEDGVRSFEQFGPSIGKLITQNAIKAVLLAALGMLIYIMFRFRWRFALASIVGVFHDVLLMIAFYGIFNITVNNPFIAAILTVVGYSINDTIVVFDRIRENHGIMSRKVPLDGLIDRSIYQTLVRSLVTGLTTVLAIFPLVIFGGEAIREFVLPLMVGIIAGAASSILIASSLYYEFAKGAYKKDKYFGATPKGGGGGGGDRDRQPKIRVEKRDDLPNAGAVV